MSTTISSLVQVRDVVVDDIGALEFSDDLAHLHVVERTLDRVADGEVAMVALWLGQRAVSLGAVDFERYPGLGYLWMLITNERLRSQGLGTRLITELEQRTAIWGMEYCCLDVADDNVRARALYERLGYRVIGQEMEHWFEQTDQGPHLRMRWVSSMIKRLDLAQ